MSWDGAWDLCVNNLCVILMFVKVGEALVKTMVYTWKVKVLVTQLCLTLCEPMDCSPPGFSVHGSLQARILERMPFHPPGTFPTHGLNLGLPHCRQILYRLSHQGNPRLCIWLINDKSLFICLLSSTLAYLRLSHVVRFYSRQLWGDGHLTWYLLWFKQCTPPCPPPAPQALWMSHFV